MKDALICIAGKLGDVKHIGHSLKDLDATKGLQWTQVWIYDRSTSHSVYRYSERLALIGTLNKLTVKVPNCINIDQGSCASQITIGIDGWLLQVLGFVPPPQWAPSEEPWILCCAPYHQLPAQLCNGLGMNINMGLGYT